MSPTDRPKPPDTGKAPDWPELDAPPTQEELRAAAALRRLLEEQPFANADSASRAAGELAQSLRAAARPKELSKERHQQILEDALRPRKKGKVVYFAFGGAAALVSMAAAIALVVRGAAPVPALSANTQGGSARSLTFSRSTAELFPEGIPRSGGTTDRVDRIAYARAQDFRQNRFARWGAP